MTTPVEGTVSNLEEDKDALQTFLILTRHPPYPIPPGSGLLPGSGDRSLELPAYRQVYGRAKALNQRYCSFMPSDDTGYRPHHIT